MKPPADSQSDDERVLLAPTPMRRDEILADLRGMRDGDIASLIAQAEARAPGYEFGLGVTMSDGSVQSRSVKCEELLSAAREVQEERTS